MTTTLFTYGTQLTASSDALQTLTASDVFRLVTADAALQSGTERLRKLCQLDKEAYKTVKTRLPYVVGSTFAANESGILLRRLDTFEAAHYFILDLDHCQDLNGRVPDAIRQDESVEMAFISPSGMGLKVFFRLLEPCDDARQFSVAYRHFATDFGTRHRFTRSIDLRTSDVTRACFLAHDPHAYYNPNAFPVDWQRWVQDPEGELLLASPTKEVTAVTTVKAPKPISETAYHNVLKQVNPRSTAPTRREKQVFVPEELFPLEAEVRALCLGLNWELTAVERLNYGLKFGIRQGYRTAEVNAFYGKKGFSLVRSPKTGTDPALSTLLYDKLYALLFPALVTENVPLAEVLSLN